MAKQKKKKFFQPRFWVLISIILVVIFGFMLAMQMVRLRSQSQTLANLENEKNVLLKEVSELQRKIEYMETDEYIERAAREQLGLMYPDEIRYVPTQP